MGLGGLKARGPCGVVLCVGTSPGLNVCDPLESIAAIGDGGFYAAGYNGDVAASAVGQDDVAKVVGIVHGLLRLRR